MDVILIPGLWLDASSWDAVTPAIETAGHSTHPLTMPGSGKPAAQSDGIGIADWVAAAVARIDRIGGPVAVVGHSGGGNVAYGAVDARPGLVSRVVYVDTAPPPDGGTISEFPVVDGVVPFPGWDFFDEPDVADLDAQTKAQVAGGALSVPARVPTDALRLSDPRRHDVPTTVLSGGLDEAAFRELVAQWPSYAAEIDRIRDLEFVRLGGGHWPQFSRPLDLGAAIVDALR